VFLGGGISGRLHVGLLYRLGVDVDQLPRVIEEVVRDYAEYLPPTWIRDGCGYRHRAEAPPVFCPNRAGPRRAEAPPVFCPNRAGPRRAEAPPVFCPNRAGPRRLFATLDGAIVPSAPPADRVDSGSAHDRECGSARLGPNALDANRR